jgi:hypothetical protein
VLFYLFFILLVSGRYYLDVVNFGNLQDLEEQNFEQQLARNPGSFLDHIGLLFSLPLHIHMN